MGNLKITLVKSLIGRKDKHIATAKSLGLKKILDYSIQPENEATLGKIKLINYLLKVEEASAKAKKEGKVKVADVVISKSESKPKKAKTEEKAEKTETPEKETAAKAPAKKPAAKPAAETEAKAPAKKPAAKPAAKATAADKPVAEKKPAAKKPAAKKPAAKTEKTETK